MQLRVIGHELGHNFGDHHASSMNCTESGARVWVSAPANCTSSEYGDPFDIMGSASTRHANNYHLAQMGFFSSADKQDVSTSGTYQLGVADVSSSTPKVLRLSRAGTGMYFYLEYRQPYGSYFDNFGSTDPAVTGVTIRLGYDYSNLSQSQLLDTTPSTSSYSDAPLGAGRSVTDATANVTFTTVSVSSTGASVQVSFGPDSQKPTMPGSFNATPTSSSTMSLSWTASSDNVAVAGYRLSRGGNLIATLTSTSYTDTGLSPNTTYNYSVVAYDAANNVSDPATKSATTPGVDVTPPSAPGTLTYQKMSGGKAKLTWGAASDNVKLGGYRLYRNGVLYKSLSATTLTYTDRLPKGTTTYFVLAYDSAGNVGPGSNSVTVSYATKTV
jgi:chitodextrinase